MARLRGLPPVIQSLPPAVGYLDRNDAERARDRARRQGNSLRRLYNTARWRHPVKGVRVRILERDEWCCQMPGCGVMLTGKAPAANSPVVDHKEPHRGNLALFWDEDNLQALCKQCHDTEKQKQEHAAEAAAGRGGVNP